MGAAAGQRLAPAGAAPASAGRKAAAARPAPLKGPRGATELGEGRWWRPAQRPGGLAHLRVPTVLVADGHEVELPRLGVAHGRAQGAPLRVGRACRRGGGGLQSCQTRGGRRRAGRSRAAPPAHPLAPSTAHPPPWAARPGGRPAAHHRPAHRTRDKLDGLQRGVHPRLYLWCGHVLAVGDAVVDDPHSFGAQLLSEQHVLVQAQA
jgi:hypothetical protein